MGARLQIQYDVLEKLFRQGAEFIFGPFVRCVVKGISCHYPHYYIADRAHPVAISVELYDRGSDSIITLNMTCEAVTDGEMSNGFFIEQKKGE